MLTNIKYVNILKITLGAVLFAIIAGCTLDVKVKNMNKSPVSLDFDIVNEPSVFSNSVVLNAMVVGDAVSKYRYKVGTSSSTDCSVETEYSAANATDTAITPNISSLPDGLLKLCVIVANHKDKWIAVTSAYEYAWTKDTLPPDAPTGLSLAIPTASPSPVSQPTIQIAGLINGYGVNLYSDSTCTTALVAGTVSGTTASLQIPTVLADGSYQFYATQTDLATNKSSCSSASVSYTMDSSLPLATITGAPTGTSGAVDIDLTIGGSNVVSYRYKILSSPITIDCDNITGYSAEDVVGNHIIQNINALPDGLIKVCVVGKNTAGTWQPLGSVTTASWTKATTPIEIYRSVESGRTTRIGFNNSGTKTLSISGTTATFSEMLDNQFGVGDVIQYDSDGNGSIDSISFIHARVSATVFTVASASGGVPTSTSSADQDWEIYRAYTSLANAEAGVENTGINSALRDFDTWSGGYDLVTNNRMWNLAMYAGADDTGIIVISGWLTNASHYIRIFTPVSTSQVGVSQRHLGFAGTGYHLLGSISVDESYVRLEGLSIENNNTSSYGSYAIYFNTDDMSESEQYLTQSVVKLSSANSSNTYTVMQNGTSGNNRTNKWYYVNNIIISDIAAGANHGAIYTVNVGGASAGFDTSYLYSNTLYSSNGLAFANAGGDYDLRNNLFYAKNSATAVQDSSGGGGDGVLTNHLNNASSDGLFAGGSGNRASQTFTFFDESLFDFRLDSQDVSAKNYGTDISANGVYNFSGDILNRTRSGNWDIGAVESAIGIYRSVGFGSTTALASGGSNTLTITSNQATFGSSLPLDIGVGDVIQYNDGAQLQLAFITGRTSATVYRVTDADGALPIATSGSTQTWSIYRAYTSFADALDGIENTSIDAGLRNFDNYPADQDLSTNNTQLNIAVYADAVDVVYTNGGALTSFNTSPTNYLKIYAPYLSSEVGQGQRHKGVWNKNYSMLILNDANGLANADEDALHFRLEGLQIENADGHGVWVRMAKAGIFPEVYLKNNLVKKLGSAGSNGFRIHAPNGFVMLANNIVYGFYKGVDFYSGGATSSTAQIIWVAYHNTVANNSNRGIDLDSPTYAGKKIYLYNNLLYQNTVDFEQSVSIATIGSANNISSDNTSPNASFRSLTPTFFNSNLQDYRLYPSDVVAKNQAYDLSSIIWPYSREDIVRHVNNTSIGAYKAADEVYRSIGATTAAIVSGAGNNMTINSSCQVSFASALPNRVGVGDVIQYDSDSNASVDSILFISYRNSSTSYRVQMADGSCSSVNVVTNIQSWSIFRAYSNTYDIETADENSGIDGNVRNFDTSGTFDLHTNNQIRYLAFYADATFVNQAYRPNYVTDDGNFVYAFAPKETYHVGVSQRHQGRWCSTGCVTFDRVVGVASGHFAWVASDHSYFVGMQIKLENNDDDWTAGYQVVEMNRGGFAVVDSNIIDAKTSYTINIGNSGMQKGTLAVITNNIVKGSGIRFDFGIGVHDNTSAFVANNTVYGTNGGDDCYRLSTDASTTQIAVNNIAQNCADAYDGSFDSGTGDNLSDLAVATGQGSDIINTTLTFINPADLDFRLAASDTAAVDSGTDVRNLSLYSLMLYDISGVTRSTPFDLGAFQYVDTTALTAYNAIGAGSLVSPYELYTKDQVHDLITNGCSSGATAACSSHFELMQNINMNNEAMTSIGTIANPFTGSFSGNNRTISNVSINQPATNCVGFFGDTSGSTYYVQNLNLSNVAVVGQNYVGAIVGCGSIDVLSSSVIGGSVTGNTYSGGAIGSSSGGSHEFVTTQVTVTATAGYGGGLIATCASCSVNVGAAHGNVTGTTNLGGAIGNNTVTATFTSLIASGNVSGTTYIGGVIGVATSAAVSNSTARGKITSTTASATHIGGFVGYADGTTAISKSTAIGDVVATNNTINVGGFAGYLNSSATLTNVTASGVVRGSSKLGGIVGYGLGITSHAVFVGRVEGNGYEVGGIVGDLYTGGEVRYSYARASIYNASGSGIGGIAGRAYSSTLRHSRFEGDVYGVGGDSVGGVAGFNAGASIYSNFSSASVLGDVAVGGILGQNNFSSSDLHDNQAEGAVQAIVEEAGGVIGWDDGTGSQRNRFDGFVIANQDAGGYAGQTSAGSSGIVQGIVNASVYSTTNGNSFIGNQLGANPTKSFWNSDMSTSNGSSAGASSANNYEGKTSVELRAQSTYSGTSAWDFATIWAIDDGIGYPVSKAMLKGECSDYKTTTSYTAVGSGTSTSPYLICNLAQYNDIGANGCGASVSTGCDKYYRLGADIDFRNSWPTEISTVTNVFSGVFNGQGFKFFNLKLTGSANNKSLFSYVSGTISNLVIESGSMSVGGNSGFITSNLTGVVTNVRVMSSEITGTGDVIAGLVAQATTGNIIGSEFMGGAVTGTAHVAGILAYHNITAVVDTINLSRVSSYITNLYSSSGTHMGGIAGELSVSATDVYINRSTSRGVATAGGNYVGGLVGIGGNIYESKSSFNISSGFDYVGGLTGGNSPIYNSYSTGVSISGNQHVGGLTGSSGSPASYSYAANDTIAGTDSGGVAPPSLITTGAYSFWDSTLSGISTGSLSNSHESKTTTELWTQSTFSNWDLINIWSIGASVLRFPKLNWELHPICRANMTASAYNSIGAGTMSNPYKICFKEQLHNLAATCGPSTVGCDDSYILLNDIDFEGDTFDMIGSNANRFGGTFDGGNHRITRLSMGTLTTDYVGFFRFASSAYVANIIFENITVLGQNMVGVVMGAYWVGGRPVHLSGVRIINSTVQGNNNVGGLIGLTDNGRIENVTVQAQITGAADVGGIVGGTNNSSGTYIANSHFYGSLSATGGVGGIAGNCSGLMVGNSVKGTITTSGSSNIGGFCGFVSGGSYYNNKILANVSGGDNTGGFAGYTQTSTIENNYYLGTITASGTYKAGLIGRCDSGTVRYNLAIPTLLGPTKGLIDSVGAATYTNNYWDSTVSGVVTGGVVNEYEAKNTTELQTSGTYIGWDFTEKWIILSNQYPEPR